MINHFEEEIFESVDFTKKEFKRGTYEYCEFINCNFSNVDMFSSSFLECNFHSSDLSAANVRNASFKTVNFIDCKLVGVKFEECSSLLFAINFTACNLNLSSFYKMNLTKSTFRGCKLQEVDFTEANLSKLNLYECNLNGAVFENSNLEKTDFRTSKNFIINPNTNRIKDSKFTKENVLGLLKMYPIIIE